jgi:hypothetical protein
MPTIINNNPGEPVISSAVTGGIVVVNEESLPGNSFVTGFISRPCELSEEALLDWVMPKIALPRIINIKSPDVFPVAETLIYHFDYGHVGCRLITSARSEQQTVIEPSPSVRRQIIAGIDSSLVNHLSQFGNNIPGQESVSASTEFAVEKLVVWLCKRSGTVSVIVSNDGMLSIAAGFSNDVRLYVEIQRGGSAGAAVTRERRYARDIPGTTVGDLTPEVILAAVGSI